MAKTIIKILLKTNAMLSKFSIIVLCFVVIFGFLATFCLGGGEMPIKDIFKNTQVIICAIWPCKIDSNLVNETGKISDLDILELERPSIYGDKDIYDKWFKHFPSYPFEFKESGKDYLIGKLKQDDNIVADSIYSKQDNWGDYVGFKAKDSPNIEIRRYPLFMILIVDRVDKPIKSKDEYYEEVLNLFSAFQKHFLKGTTIAEILNTVKTPWALHKYPFVVVTHINDYDAFMYLRHMYEGAIMTEYWTKEQLLEMGAIPRKDYDYVIADELTFVIQSFFEGEILRTIVSNKPPIKNITHWQLANPLNRAIERLIRFAIFTHVILPEYINQGKDDVAKEFDNKIKNLRKAHLTDEDIKQISEEFDEFLVIQRATLKKLKGANEKISEICNILDDAIMLEEQARGSKDWIDSTKEFGEKYTIPLLETGLRNNFIKSVLKYNLGPNHTYDTRKILKQNQAYLEQEIQELERSIEGSFARFEQQLSLSTNMFTLTKSIKHSWKIAIISLILGNLVIGLLLIRFQDDVKNFSFRKYWHNTWEKIKSIKIEKNKQKDTNNESSDIHKS